MKLITYPVQSVVIAVFIVLVISVILVLIRKWIISSVRWLFGLFSNLKRKFLEKMETTEDHTLLVTISATLLGAILPSFFTLFYPFSLRTLNILRNNLHYPIIIAFLFILLLYGHKVFDGFFHRWLLSHRAKRKRIGVLSDLEEKNNEGRFTKTHTTPSEWKKLLSKAFHEENLDVKVEQVSIDEVLHSYIAILNPYGGVYPETDLTSFQSFEHLLEYVEEGGIYVNVADVPFFWAYNKKLGRKLSLLKGQRVFVSTPQKQTYTVVSQQSHTILSRLDLPVKFAQKPYPNITVNGGTFKISRYLTSEPNIEGLLSCKIKNEEAYPVAQMAYGEGDFLFSLFFLEVGFQKGNIADYCIKVFFLLYQGILLID